MTFDWQCLHRPALKVEAPQSKLDRARSRTLLAVEVTTFLDETLLQRVHQLVLVTRRASIEARPSFVRYAGDDRPVRTSAISARC